MTAPTTDLDTPATPGPGQTHGCVRCGARISLDLSMCERCNPLGLPQPATSQAHGTVALGLFIGVVVLAIVAKLAVAGVGPFTGTVADVVPAPGGVAVTLSVHNDGTKEGTTTCRVFDPTAPGIGDRPVLLQSPRIAPGASAEFTEVVTVLGPDVRTLAVECR
jgi:hypothetical protein